MITNNQTGDLYEGLGGSDFSRMRTYLAEMRSSMQNQKSILGNYYKSVLEAFPNPLAVKLANIAHENTYMQYDTHFKGILLNAALVSTYSIFEVTFKRVCLYAAEVKGIKKPHFGISSIIDTCKQFTQNDIRIDLSEVEEFWEQINLGRQLRNKIIHHAATIPAGNEDLINHVKASNYIHISNPGEPDIEFYIKNDGYIFEFINLAHSYPLWILMKIANQPNN